MKMKMKMKKSTSHKVLSKKNTFFSKVIKELDTKNNEIVPLIPFQEENWGKEGLEV